MKKSTKITLGAIAAVSALYVGGIAPVAMPSGLVGSAYATTLDWQQSWEIKGTASAVNTYSGKDSVNNDIVNFDVVSTKYSTDKLHYITATININSKTLATILAQKPGSSTQANAPVLSKYYYGIELDDGSYYTPGSFEKSYGKVAKGASLATIQNAARELLTENLKDSSTILWPGGGAIIVQYRCGSAWCESQTEGHGDISIEQDLRNKLNRPTGELVYGTDYRIYVDDSQDIALVWRSKDSTHETDEYALLSLKVNATPVAAIEGTKTTFYATVEEALKAGATYITVNEATSASEDIVIPAGTTLEVNANLTVANGKTLTNNGTLIINANKILTVEDEDAITNNGTITLKSGSTNSNTRGKIDNNGGQSIYNKVTIQEYSSEDDFTSKTSWAFTGTKLNETMPEKPGFVTKMTVTGTDNNCIMDHYDVTIEYRFKEATEENSEVTEEHIDSALVAGTNFGAGEPSTLLQEVANADEVKDLLSTNNTVKVSLEVEQITGRHADEMLRVLPELTRFSTVLNEIGATVDDIEGIYDAELVVEGDNDDRKFYIHELGDNAVTLAVKLPSDAKDTDKFYIIRLHVNAEEELEVIPIELTNIKDGIATFKNDKFSTFMLARIENGNVITPINPTPEDTETPEEPTPEAPETPVVDKPTIIPEGLKPEVQLTAAETTTTKVADTGVFTNLEKGAKTSNSSSIIAAIAATVAVAVAAIAKLFKKANDEQ